MLDRPSIYRHSFIEAKGSHLCMVCGYGRFVACNDVMEGRFPTDLRLHMSVEEEVCDRDLLVLRQAAIIERMRRAITYLGDIAYGAVSAAGPGVFPHAASRIAQLRAVADLTVDDIGREQPAKLPAIQSSDLEDDRQG